MNQTIKREPISVKCDDGVILKGMLLIPENIRAVIQFNGGTALRKEYYLPFLDFLAGHGYLCCLWDYRGSGESAPATLKRCDYTFSDYGVKDMPAIKQYLLARFPDLPFLIVAHSVGGQQIGFMKDLSGIKGMVTFAVSTGYFGHMPWRFRLLSAYFFYLFAPLSIALTGYMASKRFNYMEDLPRNVVREWRSWCWKKDYFFNRKFMGKTVPEGTFQQYDFPVHAFWTTDDSIANKGSVPQYWKNVKSSKGITIQKVTPAQLKARKIDHMGFFKKSFRNTIWKETVEKLDSYLSA